MSVHPGPQDSIRRRPAYDESSPPAPLPASSTFGSKRPMPLARQHFRAARSRSSVPRHRRRVIEPRPSAHLDDEIRTEQQTAKANEPRQNRRYESVIWGVGLRRHTCRSVRGGRLVRVTFGARVRCALRKHRLAVRWVRAGRGRLANRCVRPGRAELQPCGSRLRLAPPFR
jgi:hypothetical protein